MAWIASSTNASSGRNKKARGANAGQKAGCVRTSVSRNSIPDASEVDWLWPYSAQQTWVLATYMAFWFGTLFGIWLAQQ